MDPETRLNELGTAWFALNCKEAHCSECESQPQCFKILAEMAQLRRKLRSNDVQIYSAI